MCKNLSIKSLVLRLLCLLVTRLTSAIQDSNVKIIAEKRLSSRIVWTKYGALRGFIINLPSKQNLYPVEAFMGIPYAIPPIGKLRFMPPVTPSNWVGIKSALSPGPVCPQNFPDITNETEVLKIINKSRLKFLKKLLPTLNNQSEDCLYLNIYSPVLSKDMQNRFPVLVFIHGESFEWNSGSSYDGSVLASFANIVVVTINFRLGILGFFPPNDEGFQGNFGLIDQVAALHWIQENIEKFGGDSTNVTLFGHSQGAVLVNLLLISPMAKGLFHRAILQSGSALSSWAMADNPITFSRNLNEKLGCSKEIKNSLIAECLRSKPFRGFTSLNVSAPKHLIEFGPTVDGIVINKDPLSLMTDADTSFGNYDLLLGLNKLEYCNFNEHETKFGITQTKKVKMLRTLIRNLYSFHLQEIYQAIENEYFDWNNYDPNNLNNLKIIAEILSDATVNAPLIKIAQIHSKLSSRTYLYNFIHESEKSDHTLSLNCNNGQDLAYIFGAPLVPGMQIGFFSSQYTKSETELSEKIIKYFANFIKNGNPYFINQDTSQNSNTNEKQNNGHNSIENTLKWPSYDLKSQKYMSFSLKPKLKDHYHSHRLSLWTQLIPKLQTQGQKVQLVEYHLLNDHNNLSTYDDNVRDKTLAFNSVNIEPNNFYLNLNESEINIINQIQWNKSLKLLDTVRMMPSLAVNPFFTQNKSHVNALNYPKQKNEGNFSLSNLIQQASYTTALSLTIGIGISFLVLNALILMGIIYHKRKITQVFKPKQYYENNQDHAFTINLKELQPETSDINFLNCNSNEKMKNYQNNYVFTELNDDSKMNYNHFYSGTGQTLADLRVNEIEKKSFPSHIAMVNSTLCSKGITLLKSSLNMNNEKYENEREQVVREINL